MAKGIKRHSTYHIVYTAEWGLLLCNSDSRWGRRTSWHKEHTVCNCFATHISDLQMLLHSVCTKHTWNPNPHRSPKFISIFNYDSLGSCKCTEWEEIILQMYHAKCVWLKHTQLIYKTKMISRSSELERRWQCNMNPRVPFAFPASFGNCLQWRV